MTDRDEPALPEPDGWALLTPNGSRLVSPAEARGYKTSYPFYTADQLRTYAAEYSAPLRAEIERLTAALAAAQPVARRVRKIGGSFQHTGTVVAEFETTAGERRIVIEFDPPVAGMLHVYRPDQVAMLAASPQAAQPVSPTAWMWQHPETGHTGFVENCTEEERRHWERVNRPRVFVCPLYASPQADTQPEEKPE